MLKETAHATISMCWKEMTWVKEQLYLQFINENGNGVELIIFTLTLHRGKFCMLFNVLLKEGKMANEAGMWVGPRPQQELELSW